MNPMKEAKPCPWCGGTDLATPPGQAVVVCGTCEATGPYGLPHPRSDTLTTLAAVVRWNERPWERDNRIEKRKPQ